MTQRIGRVGRTGRNALPTPTPAAAIVSHSASAAGQLRSPRRRNRLRDERGAGLIALTWSVLAYLMFLMLAVQVAMNLYATSVITAVGHDATRLAAFAGGSARGIADAERWLRSRIGPAVDIDTLRWSRADGVVSLQLVAHPPRVMIDTSALTGSRRIERRFVVRSEQASFSSADR